MYRFVCAVTLLLTAAGSAAGQDWPARQVTMVVPYAAGGGVDILGRMLAPHMSDRLGQQVVIENAGGAGGVTGTLRVAKAAPDGYQFVHGTAGTHAQNESLYKNPPYRAARDFAPVALIAEAPIVMVARHDLPVGNLKEFIAYARANKSKLQYSSPGTGSAPHLACVLLNAAIGINTTHIPYRGSSQALQDLIAGRIDYLCATITGVVPQVESKSVKAIALLSRERSPGLPQLASAHEQGLTNFDAPTWYAFFAPRGTPALIVRRLNEATVAAMNVPAVQSRLKEIGVDLVAPVRRTPEYLQGFVETEVAKWAAPIKAAGLNTQ